ncbi:MAG: 1-deoxy-D-xylulose-5-phosphate reductoisomerase [Candidatus Obscuribacterales bacterium]|nr:1-deoxy-D-xylulose-5-phosphate reductoisomerase [Candidatus Obscuribacterales bacterium]
MKNLSILGSTGSIGQQTLDIVRAHQEDFRVLGLSAGGKNLELLAAQIEEFHPELVSVPNADQAAALKALLSAESRKRTEIIEGENSSCELAAMSKVDTVLSGVVGARGIKPTAAAAQAGKTIALANKETLVAAGSIIMPMVIEHNAKIVPVDSEHSAIHQSMAGFRTKDLKKVILTGSGGPFRKWSREQIEAATVDDALKHPNWAMGQKITIDSATLMNKGLEIIEARWLFEIPASMIEVVIHPQSILHSAVEFVDGSIVGQLGMPDMHLPIHYALYYPERKASTQVPALDLLKLAELNFEAPDYTRFPCLRLAKEVAARDDSAAAVLNAANEELVYEFLNRRIKFMDIPGYVEKILDLHQSVSHPSLDDILEADKWARQASQELLGAAVR